MATYTEAIRQMRARELAELKTANSRLRWRIRDRCAVLGLEVPAIALEIYEPRDAVRMYLGAEI